MYDVMYFCKSKIFLFVTKGLIGNKSALVRVCDALTWINNDPNKFPQNVLKLYSDSIIKFVAFLFKHLSFPDFLHFYNISYQWTNPIRITKTICLQPYPLTTTKLNVLLITNLLGVLVDMITETTYYILELVKKLGAKYMCWGISRILIQTLA